MDVNEFATSDFDSHFLRNSLYYQMYVKVFSKLCVTNFVWNVFCFMNSKLNIFQFTLIFMWQPRFVNMMWVILTLNFTKGVILDLIWILLEGI
jgi:hypothetical protein